MLNLASIVFLNSAYLLFNRARICKRLSQAGNRFQLGSLKGLQIRAQLTCEVPGSVLGRAEQRTTCHQIIYFTTGKGRVSSECLNFSQIVHGGQIQRPSLEG
jgi:hypothetical protein